ncbi:acyl-CoA thioesterase [Alkalicoccus halolimnae]|uniref:Thioesterase family protein n=1 Tax=Alkalicoccus halolimnae TaxID=1667239 RepID=A0A5C7F5B6_9BACI|nr:thioesterase family protein [Alkalicoccus halolimnae]TXF85792.1 acyl-CoA thioesterase [Alkalicoccus halolimnae]
MALPAYIENPETWEKEFTFFDSLKVRFSETDAFGHVNNTVAFVYFEQARIHYFEHLGLMKEWVQGPHMIVTGDLQCDYVRQVKFGEELEVGVKAAYVGRTSVDVHYMIKNADGKLCMTGRGRIVQIDKEKGGSAPWNEDMRAVLETA